MQPPDQNRAAGAYRIAQMVDRGSTRDEVVKATGAAPEDVDTMMNMVNQEPGNPNAPSATDLVILNYLFSAEGDSRSTKAIAEFFSVTPQEIIHQMAGMIQKGLVNSPQAAPQEAMGQPTAYAPNHHSNVVEGTPKAATRLTEQACAGGYVPGTDEDKDAELTLASHMVSPETTLIKLDMGDMKEIFRMISDEEEPTAAGWPSSNVTYIEIDVPRMSENASPMDRIVGIMTGPASLPDEPGNERTVIILLDEDQRINNHAFRFDPDRGTPRPAAPGQTTPADPQNMVGRMMYAVLAHLSGDDNRLKPAPMPRGQRRRAQRGEPYFQWLVVNKE